MDSTAAYQDALVVYSDMLGFKDLVERSTSGELSVSYVRDVLARLKAQLSPGHLIAPDADGTPTTFFQSHTFSDHVVRCLPVGKNQQEQCAQEFFHLARIQGLLAIEGILIRGGITFGRVFVDSSFVFGPALVRSYELEQNAIYPRLVIDKDLVHDVRLSQDYVECGEDCTYFLDYLFGPLVAEHAVHGHDPWPVLKAHKEMVQQKLCNKTLKEGVRRKFLWLARYHNSAVKRLRGRLTGLRADQFYACEIDGSGIC
ncbi:MAG: hypothetical protein ACRD3A_05130 [Terriglobales bacterium]